MNPAGDVVARRIDVEYGVRWPSGEVEECADVDQAVRIVRLHGCYVIVRTVTTECGAWSRSEVTP